jgi:hypothetical protein
VHKVLEWNCQSEDVDESENFKPVIRPLFIVKEQAWNSSNKIKDKVSLKITTADAAKVLVSSAVLNEIQENLNCLNDINGEFNLVKCFLSWGFKFVRYDAVVSFGVDVDFLEDDYIWEDDQVVNNQ